MNSSATYIYKKNVSSQKTRTLNRNKHKEWLKEINIQHFKKSFKPPIKTTAAYIHAYVEHKMERWDREHPKPWKWEGTEQFLFEKEYLKPWEQEREKQLEYTRNFVCSVCNKLLLIGRYKQSIYQNKEKILRKLSNKFVHKYKSVIYVPEKDKTLQKIQSIINIEKQNNNLLLCGIIRDPIKDVGRILSPIAA